MVAKNN